MHTSFRANLLTTVYLIYNKTREREREIRGNVVLRRVSLCKVTIYVSFLVPLGVLFQIPYHPFIFLSTSSTVFLYDRKYVKLRLYRHFAYFQLSKSFSCCSYVDMYMNIFIICFLFQFFWKGNIFVCQKNRFLAFYVKAQILI